MVYFSIIMVVYFSIIIYSIPCAYSTFSALVMVVSISMTDVGTFLQNRVQLLNGITIYQNIQIHMVEV